jgi:hypothetical protein
MTRELRFDVNEIGTPVDGFEGEIWELKRGAFVEDADYWDAAHEMAIWSIGRRKTDGRVFASVDSRFYQNAMFYCIWLR